MSNKTDHRENWVVACDIGGTFTDTVLIHGAQGIFFSKSPTTPNNLVDGIMSSLERAAKTANISLPDLLSQSKVYAHGTTVATNAAIERKGVKTGFITTRGFRDLLVLMKGERGWGLAEMNKLRHSHVEKQIPLVPLELTEEVTERVDYTGTAIVPLNEAETEEAVRRLVQKGVEALAVSFLWSFRNPDHERKVKEIVRRIAPNAFVTISSDLVPERGEYERSVTTAINCQVSPVLARYLKELGSTLSTHGFKHNPLIMQSSGGLMPVSDAAERGVKTLLSGPAGGIIASKYLSDSMKERNIIATDMGGTSFDVGLIIDGKPVFHSQSFIPESDPYRTKFRVLMPSIDIESIGAGGGSIAWVDHNILNVGPMSAGASPGPACYGKGGSEPTVTDADVVLGYIAPDYFLGGALELDKSKAEEAIRKKIAQPLGLSVPQAAAGIATIVNSHMANLVRKMTIERGHDPRECLLFAYGGAGPTHCAVYGAELGVKAIVVPSGLATVYSAFGIAHTDLRYSGMLADRMMEIDAERVNRNFKRLEQEGMSVVHEQWGIPKKDIEFHRVVDVRYKLQTHEIATPVPAGVLSKKAVAGIVETFEELYELNYGTGSVPEKAQVEFVNFRVDTVGRLGKHVLSQHRIKGASPRAALKTKRKALFNGKFVDTEVYTGEKLTPGNLVKGPAIVEYMGTTAVIQPGQKAHVDKFLNLVIEFTR